MKSTGTPSVAEFGRRGVIFEEQDVIRLLRAEIKMAANPFGRGEIVLSALT
jgi:hypothetical protein